MADKLKILREISSDAGRVKALNEKIDAIEKQYEQAVSETESKYRKRQTENLSTADKNYRKNAVEYLANQHRLDEDMANKGLENSGLNAKLKENALLSAQSTDRLIAHNKQKTSADLVAEEEAEKTALVNERDSKIASAKEKWEKENNSEADKVYRAQVSLEKEEIKAKASSQKNSSSKETSLDKEEEEEKKRAGNDLKAHKKGIITYAGHTLSRDFEGTLSQNGVEVYYNDDGTVTYRDTTTGLRSVFAISANPFTGDNNAKGGSDTARAWRKYGYFSNGYQPRGVFYLGGDYGKVTATGYLTKINGNHQNIFSTPDGTLWVWDGKTNCYTHYKGKLDMNILQKEEGGTSIPQRERTEQKRLSMINN